MKIADIEFKSPVGNVRLFILQAMLLIFLAGCKKEVKVEPFSETQINFYNASFLVQQQIKTKSMPGALILFDTEDPNFKPENSVNGFTMPYFGNSDIFARQFPNETVNARKSQPWTIYMHTGAGAHNVTLLDTGRKVLVKSKIATAIDKPVTVYFTDSLGVFHQMVTVDEQLPVSNKFRLRMVHLSPDAAEVYATVDGKTLGEIGKGLKYRSFTAYQDLESTRTDTLKINVYKKGDPTTAIAKAFLETQPGHSYTMVLSGYQQGGVVFKGPGGEDIVTSRNLELFINKSF